MQELGCYGDKMINLMLGDCLERMKEIPDGSVDMVLADLLMVQLFVNGIVLYRLSRCGNS